VDGGKARIRIIVNALVSPFEVAENAPMLDLLWRSVFRWRLRPAQLTGDTAYGTTENIAAVERANIRAYVPLSGADKARPYFSKELFAYDPERDLYRCPAGETLFARTKNKARRLSVYKANAGTCEACELRPRCTENKTGRQVLRYFDEAYVERVRAYRGTFPYEKALRKRRVWVEPLFAEAKDRHGLRRFRLRQLEKVNIETLLVASGQRTSSGCSPSGTGVRGRRLRPRPCGHRRDQLSMLLTRGRGYFRPPRRPLHDVLQQSGKLRPNKPRRSENTSGGEVVRRVYLPGPPTNKD